MRASFVIIAGDLHEHKRLDGLRFDKMADFEETLIQEEASPVAVKRPAETQSWFTWTFPTLRLSSWFS